MARWPGVLNVTLRALRAAKRRLVPGFRLTDHPRLLAAWERGVTFARRDRLDDVLGHRMRLDPLDSLRLSFHGLYQPAETRFVQRVVAPGWTVVDVGANIGYFTLLFCRAVGPAGRVLAFEPDPDNAAILRENLRLNGYANAQVLELALGDADGSATLFTNPANRGDNRVGIAEPGFGARAVRVGRYDDLVGGTVDLVKLDVQGGELAVLLGLAATLARSPDPLVVLEWWPLGLTRAGCEPAAVLDRLGAWGFALHRLTDAGDLVPTSRDELLRTTGHGPTDQVDLVARRTRAS
jgi:FkbM family methyltransferase